MEVTNPTLIFLTIMWTSLDVDETVQTIASTVKEHWISPTIASLHWDFKILPVLKNSSISEGRLTVIIGTQQETKLLGSSTYQLS